MGRASAARLGEALLRAGQAEEAVRAFEIAATSGWRVPLTQLYWLEQARAVENFPAAVQHLEAVSRIGLNPTLARQRFLELEATQKGRDALVRRLEVDPSWAALEQVSELTARQLDHRAALVLTLADRGVQLAPSVSRNLAYRLLERGDARKAWRLRAHLTAKADRGNLLLFDGDFEEQDPALRDGSAPFGWHLEIEPGISASTQPAPAPMVGRALLIRSSTRGTARGARQTLVLAPANYVLSWRQQATGAQVIPSLACAGGATIPLKLAKNRTSPSYGFTVPSTECSVQQLTLIVDTSAEAGGAVWIDAMQLSADGEPED